MRLALQWVEVRDVRASTATRLVEQTLEVHLEALQALLETDTRLQRVRFARTHNLVLSAWPAPGIERVTYLRAIQNHPVIRSLYEQHGQTLWFVGVVLTVAQATEPERVRFNEKVSRVGAAPVAQYRLLLDWILAGEPGGLIPLDFSAPAADAAGRSAVG